MSELVFYDAFVDSQLPLTLKLRGFLLKVYESAVDVLGDETLKLIAAELWMSWAMRH
ncbi:MULTISPECIES: hypothetical protein [unclassified Methanosarcina]|uniref:hypothetical protein n=1 Tax=unclassified Methanosarcina TaxID=2644672 RepID=UPI0018CCCC8D|nr:MULTISPECIES: hypothetical protein [unclassified Methanosarcina]